MTSTLVGAADPDPRPATPVVTVTTVNTSSNLVVDVRTLPQPIPLSEHPRTCPCTWCWERSQ